MRTAPKTSIKEWIERFGIYFLGVAIGLMIVGAIWSIRAQAVDRNREVTAAQEPAAPGGTPGTGASSRR